MKKLLIIISFISTNIYGQHLDFAFKLGGSYEDECYDMAIDTQMNIYITGGFCNEVDFNPNGTPFILTSNNTDRASAFLAKYDSNVNLVWAFSLKGDSWWENGLCLEIDDSLNVYMIGNFEGTVDFDPSVNEKSLSAAEMSYYLAKYNSDGEFQWVKDIGNYEESYLVAPPRTSMIIDRKSNIYISHVHSLHKYKSNGELLWSKGLKGNAAFDGDRSLYMLIKSGTPWSQEKYDSLKLIKIDTSGQILIDKTIIKNTVGDVNGYLTFDKSGNLLINGDYWGTSIFKGDKQNKILNNVDLRLCTLGPGQGYYDCPLYHEYFAKFDTTGNVIWTHDFGADGPDPYIIETTTNGTIFTIGRLNRSVDFDPTDKNATLSYSEYRVYIAKYDSSCAFLSATGFKGLQIDLVGDFNIIDNSKSYICGHFYDKLNLDFYNNSSQILISQLGDIFVGKYSDFDIYDISTTFIHGISKSTALAYPNPTDKYVNIVQDLSTIEKISIYSQNGYCILSIDDYSGKPIDLGSLSPGIYLIQIVTTDKNYAQKIIKCN